MKKDDDNYKYEGIVKSSILQDAQIFSSTPLDLHRCNEVLCDIVYLLIHEDDNDSNQGGFTVEESTELFFTVTKLLQTSTYSNFEIRQLVYFIISELSSKISSSDVLIIISSLIKDLNSQESFYRRCAIKVLTNVLGNESQVNDDKSNHFKVDLLLQVSRMLKEALLDPDPNVSVPALVGSATKLFNIAPNVIKTFSNEANEVASQAQKSSTQNKIAQYHAMVLLYQLKKGDKGSLKKFIANFLFNSKNLTKFPLVGVFILRVVGYYIRTYTENENPLLSAEDIITILNNCSNNANSFPKSVGLELCNLVINNLSYFIGDNNNSANLNNSLINSITNFLNRHFIYYTSFSASNNSSTIEKFAGLRVLDKLSQKLPQQCFIFNNVLEKLISDSNRSIATLAVTILLRTGTQFSIDGIVKSIFELISEISDEFKVVLINAIKNLALKFPSKHEILLKLLSSIIREEGGYEFTSAVVDTIVTISNNTESLNIKEIALELLADYIEDCEYQTLLVKLLMIIATQGGKSSQPEKYLRAIYNRVVLENEIIRAASITSLVNFGLAYQPLLNDVKLLISKSCLVDNDDEVRDRAAFFLELLNSANDSKEQKETSEDDVPISKEVLLLSLNKNHVLPDLDALEEHLQDYLSSETLPKEPFQFDKVPKFVSKPVSTLSLVEEKEEKFVEEKETVVEVQEKTNDILSIVDSLLKASLNQNISLGSLFKITPSSFLNEEECELPVSYHKLIYQNYFLFLCEVRNLLSNDLTKIYLEVDAAECSSQGYHQELVIPIPTLEVSGSGYCLLMFRREPSNTNYNLVTTPTLKFTSDNEEEELQLDQLSVTISDFISSPDVGSNEPLLNISSFRKVWDSVSSANECVKKYNLNSSNLQLALEEVLTQLGNIYPIPDAGIAISKSEYFYKVSIPEGSKVFALNLHGIMFPNIPVYVRIGLMLNLNSNTDDGSVSGITLKIAARCKEISIAERVINETIH